MRFSARAIAFATLGVTPALLLTSCGGDDTGARTTLGTVQTTSYVVEQPVTTTTTTTLPTATPEGQIDPNEQIHVVSSGDSVYKIASLYGITPDALANYNDWSEGINHPLFQGDQVKIPAGSQVPSETPDDAGSSGTGSTDGGTSTQTTEAPSGTGCSHTVVANDNPTRVANQYDITVEELAAANAGNSAYQNFLIGSQLSIPANGNCP